MFLGIQQYKFSNREQVPTEHFTCHHQGRILQQGNCNLFEVFIPKRVFLKLRYEQEPIDINQNQQLCTVLYIHKTQIFVFYTFMEYFPCRYLRKIL
jgi:hypothetical protein